MATVLVVEDDLDISNAIREALTEEGWIVLLASSSEEATRALAAGQVDVVLCDVLLQDGSDGRALKAKAATLGLGHLPFGFMTASTREMQTLSGAHVLQKPFGTSELLQVLHGMLSEREDQRRPSDASS
jgi:two-component system, sensor histidine kinase and response regulator